MPSQKTKIDEILDQALAEGPTPGVAPDLSQIVSDAATTHGVPEALIHAVIDKESSGRVNAKSQVGASGLMQLMPATAKSLGVKNVNDPAENINGGTAYLRQLHEQFGSWDLALAAYNAGPGNVRKYDGIPPFKETKNYVNTIMKKVGDVPAPGSSIDQILDDAGVPPIDPGAPMQEGASAPQVPPTEMGVADILAPNATGNVQEQSPNASTALAASKSFLDALGVGAIARQMAKSETLRDANVSVNKLLTGRDQSFEDIARERQGVTSDAQKEHPIASGAGTVAGILAPVGATSLAGKAVAKVIPAAKGASVLTKLTKFLTEGAVQGGTFEAVSNPQATKESVADAAKVGAATNAIMAPVLAGAKVVSKGFGNALINFSTKTGRPEVAEYITKYIGPTLTKTALAEKNQKVLDVTENALQAHLTKLDEAGNAGVNMKEIINSPSVLKDLKSLENSGNTNLANRIKKQLERLANRGTVQKGDIYSSPTGARYSSTPTKVATQESTVQELLTGKLPKTDASGGALKISKVDIPQNKNGIISLGEANQLKRDLYKQANFNTQSQKPNQAAILKKVALTLKSAIEDASGSNTVKELNQKLQNGIELKDAVTASASANRLRAYIEIGTAIAQPVTLPAIAAGRFLTSTPGSTLLGSAASKIPQAVSPQVQTLLNTLVPQVAKKDLTNKGR